MRAAAALLAVLCAAGAAHAESHRLEKGAPADASLEERLEAKARTIPGTEVRYVVAGFVQFDALWTRRELAGDEKDAFIASAIPFGAAPSDARFSARASQINAILKAPTGWGGLSMHAQADLFAYDEGAQPNLTQLVLRLGEWLTVGKTYSTFMDDEAWPATLDYNGPSGAVFARQFVLRLGAPLGEALRVEAAFEDPQSEHADRPDFVARLRFGGERLHAQLGALSRASSQGNGSGVSASAGLGLGESGRLLAQWTRGEGVSRYFNDGLSGIDESQRLIGLYLYYEREWSARWNSTLGWSELRADGQGAQPLTELKRVQYASANLVHRLSTDLFLGAELLWGKSERLDGAQADDSRVQLTARYLVY